MALSLESAQKVCRMPTLPCLAGGCEMGLFLNNPEGQEERAREEKRWAGKEISFQAEGSGGRGET